MQENQILSLLDGEDMLHMGIKEHPRQRDKDRTRDRDGDRRPRDVDRSRDRDRDTCFTDDFQKNSLEEGDKIESSGDIIDLYSNNFPDLGTVE